MRAGAALLLAAREISAVRPHDMPARTLLAVPGGGSGSGGSPHFEDDGESWSLVSGDHFAGDVRMEWSGTEVRVAVRARTGHRRVAASDLSVESPTIDGRTIVKI